MALPAHEPPRSTVETGQSELRRRPSALSRRSFLARSLGAGIGALGLVSGIDSLDPTGAAASSGAASPVPPYHVFPAIPGPPIPSGYHAYVSRPDLRPPSINIVTSGVGSRTSPYIFVAPRRAPGGTMPAGSQRGLMILDRRGGLVWFQPQTANGADPFNFRVQSYNNKPVLTWFQGSITDTGISTGGEYVIASDQYAKVTTLKAVNYPSDLHEFLLTPESTALVTTYEPAAGSHPVIGHAQEIDVATNDLLFDWASYPAVPISDSFDTAYDDYFHINSIDVWPGASRDLLISSRNTSCVYLVSRANKSILWRVGGKKSTFAIGTDAEFSFQHDARALWDGSGISVFDDASQPSSEKQSSGKVINLNQTTKKATIRHQYLHNTYKIDTASQGNCQLLPTGGHFLGWGAAPAFSEFGPASSAFVDAPMILDGRFPNGVESYRAFLFDWVGIPPASEIALVVHKGAATGSFVSYVSWNGATEVADWVFTAGTSTSTLAHVVTAPRLTFETAVSFTKAGATDFQARAYGPGGTLLGESKVVNAS